MPTIIIVIFLISYFFIAFEHYFNIDKAASALIGGVLCWVVLIWNSQEIKVIENSLMHHFAEISSILFFLLGAMTIVELIDSNNGFDLIKKKITTNSKSKLLWLITIITFFMSAILDNLTSTIIMVSIVSKLLQKNKDVLFFTGMIIISANAGGVFSPIGDVTTTMLWIGGQLTAQNLILKLFIPSFFVIIGPLLILTKKFKNKEIINDSDSIIVKRESKIILVLGVVMLVFVPTFKVITHLPPFMGVMLALGITWFVVSYLQRKNLDKSYKYNVTHALQRIDSPSILFFLGILLSVSALQESNLLSQAALGLSNLLKNDYLIGSTLGILSAFIDNVPLVAAAQGMYTLDQYPTDHSFWEFLALTSGTGGSAIIIGSAAGVAAMGLQKISFVWYLKKISGLAILGFVTGIIVYLIQNYLLSL